MLITLVVDPVLKPVTGLEDIDPDTSGQMTTFRPSKAGTFRVADGRASSRAATISAGMASNTSSPLDLVAQVVGR